MVLRIESHNLKVHQSCRRGCLFECCEKSIKTLSTVIKLLDFIKIRNIFVHISEESRVTLVAPHDDTGYLGCW